MQITFKDERILIKFCFLSLLFCTVELQENDFKCSKYKKMIYEETKTFSYFLADVEEKIFTEDHCTASTGFIVGGVDAKPKEFVFAVRLGSVFDNGYVNWFCGGTLISESFVLTAAHCFHVPIGNVNRVRIGELDFDSDTEDAEPEDINVQKLIEHPDYNHNLHYNDIGLVKLSSEVQLNRYKHPACLPISISLKNADPLVAIGWGHTKFAGKDSSHLQKVALRFYPSENCQRVAGIMDDLPKGLQSSQLCAVSPEEKDTCQGDSGSPLLVQHPIYPCMLNVVGITSFSLGRCATPNVPGIYTNVSFYIDWISKYVN